MRSLASLAHRLRADVELRVVTGDRDLGDERPYPDVAVGRWTTHAGVGVLYLPPDGRIRRLASLLRRERYDVLYVNSVFATGFGIPPVLLRRVARGPGTLLINPRGELAEGALQYSRGRKRTYLTAARATGLFSGARWHAASELEADEIRRQIGARAEVHVAPNLGAGAAPPLAARSPKPAGRAQLVFLSRISPKKNLLGVLQALATIQQPGITLDVYGPIEDRAYWSDCQRVAGATVQYRGTVEPDDVVSVLSQYDAFILPTYGENYGHVIAEALSAGTPAIIGSATPWGDLETRTAGWTVDPDDHPALAEAILRVAGLDASEHAQRVRAAHELANAVLSDPGRRDANVELFRWAAR